MQTRSRLLEDTARFLSSLSQLASASKSEADDFVKQHLQNILNDMNVVPRDEFEAVKAMAMKALEENQQLKKQIQQLKTKINKKDKN